MSCDKKKLQENLKNLKAVDYNECMLKDNNHAPEMLRFRTVFIDDVLKSGRFKGSSLLEIGSGSLVHNIAAASAYFPRIVMSDFLEDNCEELKKWLQGRSPIKQFLGVAADLEGHTNDLELGKKLLEKRIRKCVKQVVRCDILRDDIFLEELKDEVSPPYDLIICIHTLELASPDMSSYVGTFRRIYKLLKPGGGLILCGCLGGKMWRLKETEYHYLDVNKEDLVNALKGAGFGIIDLRIQDRVAVDFDYNHMYCVAAEKI